MICESKKQLCLGFWGQQQLSASFWPEMAILGGELVPDKLELTKLAKKWHQTSKLLGKILHNFSTKRPGKIWQKNIWPFSLYFSATFLRNFFESCKILPNIGRILKNGLEKFGRIFVHQFFLTILLSSNFNPTCEWRVDSQSERPMKSLGGVKV